MFRDSRVFLKQFFRQYHTTGSVLPSSRALAKALCRYVDYKTVADLSNGTPEQHTDSQPPHPSPLPPGERKTVAQSPLHPFSPSPLHAPVADAPGSPSIAKEANAGRQILEVGPGTGAVTARLVTSLRPDDRLTLCELNDDFVRHLQQRFATEPDFAAVAERTQIEHKRLENLPGEHCYDVIISGLPLNNFEVREVEQILDIFRRLLKPGGTLSFFEYIAIRKAKSLVTTGAGRARLRGIGQALERILNGQEIKRDWVWPNVPPAWVHHVRLGTLKV